MKRKRGKNFTTNEKQLFLQILKCHPIIDSKGMENATKRQQAWDLVTVEYNSHGEFEKREKENLKSLWWNLKIKAKKDHAIQLNGELVKTGKTATEFCKMKESLEPNNSVVVKQELDEDEESDEAPNLDNEDEVQKRWYTRNDDNSKGLRTASDANNSGLNTLQEQTSSVACGMKRFSFTDFLQNAKSNTENTERLNKPSHRDIMGRPGEELRPIDSTSTSLVETNVRLSSGHDRNSSPLPVQTYYVGPTPVHSSDPYQSPSDPTAVTSLSNYHRPLSPPSSQVSDSTEVNPRKRSRTVDIEDRMMAFMERFDESDEDKDFFRSLLPSVRSLTEDQKLEFRAQVILLLQRIKRQGNNIT